MGSVVRIPTQHKSRPHCASCGQRLPNFNSMVFNISSEDLGSAKLEAITFHVRCDCGTPWDLRKAIKP
jgi:hypothetical protein